MFSVHQPWDPLKVCAVGQSYPPEFYSWIKIPHVRKLFERIAVETEEDYQKLIKLLKQFNVEIIRPDLKFELGSKSNSGTKEMPPMCPRDHMIMIGNQLYYNSPVTWNSFYNNIKDSSWPECENFESASTQIQLECLSHGWNNPMIIGHPGYRNIFEYCQQHHVPMLPSPFKHVNGATTTRIGKDLYFGTVENNEDLSRLKILSQKQFPNYRTHVVNTVGHSDGTYCPVTPGLIISLVDVPTYADTFPDWEVVYLPGQSWSKVKPFLDLKKQNKGKWWIPGFEKDQAVIETVETWLNHWTGYVEETVFDVNMLVIDQKNVVVFGYNDIVFKVLSKYNITPHVVPLRHRYFWDGGLHCITSDLCRQGPQQDFFPDRNQCEQQQSS